MRNQNHPPNDSSPNKRGIADPVHEKLLDAEVPGFQVELSPDEAECAGAFVEDALSEADALESAIDLVDINPTSPSNP